ncbi:MAG TPA: site-specific integrase [Gemmataceae bacterium]|jgi:integrase|nr:site-specific integrase [Gemmataceae bacterium]
MKLPKPWYRASKSAWYVEHNLKQVRLDEHPEGAPPPKKSKSGWNAPQPILDAFYKLMATNPANLPKPDRITVALICDLFLDHSQKHHAPDTYGNYQRFLQSFCDRYGRNPAAELKPFHVTRWMDDHPTWKGGRRHAVIAVRRALSWAEQQGILTPNPLRTLKADRVKCRTRVLTKDELSEILTTIRDRQFREFMQAMLETGCRPSEVARVTAANVNLDVGVWVFDRHKSDKKTSKPRVVYLTPAMVELSRKLIQQYPNGPLFRGPRDKTAFSRQNIRCRLKRLRTKLPHLKHFVCYSVRHTFATQALIKGVGVAQVAELLGHASTEMVSRTYGHLADQVVHMREAAARAASPHFSQCRWRCLWELG